MLFDEHSVVSPQIGHVMIHFQVSFDDEIVRPELPDPLSIPFSLFRESTNDRKIKFYP